MFYKQIITTIILCCPFLVSQLQVVAGVDATVAKPGDQIHLTVIVVGNSHLIPIAKPKLRNARYLAPPQKKVSVEWLQQTPRSICRYQYPIQVLAAGKAHISPVEISINSHSYQSLPIEIAVGDSKVPHQQRDIFFDTQTSRYRLYQGEIVTLTTALYIRENIRITAEKYKQYAKGELSIVKQSSQNSRFKVHGGKIYRCRQYQYLLVAPQTGELMLPQFVYRATVLSATNKKSPFDEAFGEDNPLFRDEFFRESPLAEDFGGKKSEIELITASRSITVSPLPNAKRPQNFTGSIGSFRVSSSLIPNKFAISERMELVLSITGQGNLDNADIAFPKHQKHFILQKKRTLHHHRVDVTGTTSKSIALLLMATKTGKFSTPKLEFSFFNPFTQSYQTRIFPRCELEVVAGREKLPEVAND